MSVKTELVTPEQVQFYQKNGYLQLPEFLSPGEVAEMKATMVRAIEEYDRRGISHHRGDVTAYSKVLTRKSTCGSKLMRE